MRFWNRFKKCLQISTTSTVLSLLCAHQAWAQGDSGYLRTIAQNTTDILTNVNSIPDYLYNMGLYIDSWLAPDTSDTTANMQTNFDALGNLANLNYTKQLAMQQQLTASMIGVDVSTLTTPTNSPSILKSFSTINNVAYSTLLGQPPVARGATSDPFAYISNASGMGIKHPLPYLGMTGPKEAKDKYSNYFNTIMAIESYNGYILSSLYAEAQNGNQTTPIQNSLIAQASNSTWLAQVASEELGKVLRQMLVFQSQSYVVLTQILQTQKQLLAATAMTNALLIANNQTNETMLLNNAYGANIVH